jgi:uncharacterized membrane protein
MTDKKTIRIIDHRKNMVAKRVAGLVYAALIASVLFGPGLLVGSAAMQWAGFVILMVLICGVIAAADHDRMTVDEAINKLQKMRDTP